jgi:hypothetical protein
MQQLPDDLVWYILQFVYLPSELHQCMTVSRQWYNIMLHDMFWKEKIVSSNWLLNSVPPDAIVLNEDEHKVELRKEREQEEEDRRNNVKIKHKKKNYYVVKHGIHHLSQPNTSTLRSFNFLMKQWFNDWISYWTSNFMYSDSESETDGDGTSSVYVFEMPMRLWQCGVAHFPKPPPPTRRQRLIVPIDPQALDTVLVEDHQYRQCYEDLLLYALLNHRVQEQQLEIEFVLNDDGQQDSQLLLEARQKFCSWSDPSSENGPSYPMIPFVSFNYQEEELTLEHFCEFINAHKELYSSNDVYTWKSVTLGHNTELEEQNNDEHPIRAAGDTIRLQDIFSDSVNQSHCEWIRSHLHDVKFVTLGSTQLNPVPVFVIGKTRNDSLAGFVSATFRGPHQ